MKTIHTLILSVLFLCTWCFSYVFLGPKWQGTNPEVKYCINEEGTPDVTNEFDAIHRGFSVWSEAPGTAIRTQYVGTTASKSVAPDKANILKWEEGSGFPFDGNVIAVCYYWYSSSALSDFDIIFNGRDFQWSTSAESGKMDVGHIATHEIGHALGLGHTSVTKAVMYAYASKGDTSHRHLATDDSLGITALYPRTGSNNHAPQISSAPIKEAIAGLKYEYRITATDADNDTIKYRLPTKPLNMQIDSLTGLITWYPKFLDIGTHTVVADAYDRYGAYARQAWQITVTDLVVFTNDTNVSANDTLDYPVSVTPTDGYAIVSGNIELTYTASEATVIGIDTAGSIIASATIAKNLTSGSIKIAFAQTQPLEGTGPLFTIRTVIPGSACGKDIVFRITKAVFNDGDPVAGTKAGTISMECAPSPDYSVDGTVTYKANGKGVDNARLVVLRSNGDTLAKAISDNAGSFVFPSLPRTVTDPFRLIAAKDSGDIANGISAYDASLILRSLVGLKTLNDFAGQTTAADVNGNKMITAFDAALVLRYLVGVDDNTLLGRWIVTPETTIIQSLTAPIHNVQIQALLIGDVSGNRQNSNDPAPSKRFAGSVAKVVLDSFSRTTETAIDLQNVFTTSIAAENMAGVYSGELTMAFDAAQYNLVSVEPLAALIGFTCAYNTRNTSIRMAFAGTEPIDGSAGLFAITLAPKNPASTATPDIGSSLLLAKFNELENSVIAIEKRSPTPARAMTTAITSLSPNPFNPMVTIAYEVEKKQNIEIAIFDLHGRHITTLAKTLASAGAYRAMWNGKDAQGRAVASGIYLVRYAADATTAIGKLYLMK